VPQSIERLFEFFSRPENLQALTPPWLEFRMVDVPKEMCAGTLIRYDLRVHKLPVHWTTEITEWTPPHGFVDVEDSGPYALWHHEHKFFAERENATMREGMRMGARMGTRMEDRVRYALPFGVLGQMARWIVVRRDLENIFDYRAEKMRELFGT
jgi:ligand-binding SRPBCC domain-containing protein